INKGGNTAIWGNITFISESPMAEGLIYVGTDDGLVQVTENGGKSWRKIERFKGVPEMTYVSSIHASLSDPNTAYASFDNHQMGDFKPYLLKTTDKGNSWVSIAGNLPPNGPVLCLAQDSVDANLLFAGTEFGVHFTIDGGKTWTQLKAGLPTIAVKDIAIQKRENDLALATFGRGFYILDDYSPLRTVSSAILAEDAHIFPVKDALMYIQASPIGGSGKAWQGDAFFTAENPPFGATFTYYLKESLKTRKQMRKDAEKKSEKDGKLVYPTMDELRAEADEDAPAILFTMKDESGNVVRRLTGANSEGINRLTWDLRMMSPDPVTRAGENVAGRGSWLAMPGKYSVTMSKRVDGVESVLAGPVDFKCVVLGSPSIPTNRPELAAFERKAAGLQRAAVGALNVLNDVRTRVGALKAALAQTPKSTTDLYQKLLGIERQLTALRRQFTGDEVMGRYNENAPPTLMGWLDAVTQGFWSSTAAPTGTSLKAYDIAADEFTGLYATLRQLVEHDVPAIDAELEHMGAPWTPGRLPDWKKE
ncbi:MAG TPA: glycosyl hydrolase, partial [Bacteroidota bacterium]|nr:glycosyl hydrolase [Bacteroidota bacterium]